MCVGGEGGGGGGERIEGFIEGKDRTDMRHGGRQLCSRASPGAPKPDHKRA